MDWVDEQMGFDESEAPGLDAEIDALFGEGGGERDDRQQGSRKGKGRPSAASKRQWGSEDMDMGGLEEGGFGVDVYGDEFGEGREDRGGGDWLEELAMDSSGEEAPGLDSGRPSQNQNRGQDGDEDEDEDRELDALMRELDEELGMAGEELGAAGPGDAIVQEDVDALLGEGIPAMGGGLGDVDSNDSAAARRRQKRKQRKAELELEGLEGASSDPVDQKSHGGELDRRHYPLSDVPENEIQARAELQRRNSKIYRQAKRLFWEEEEYRRAAEILCKEDYVRVPVSD